MKMQAILSRFKNEEYLERDYILAKFLIDVRDRKEPLLIPSISFISANFERLEDNLFFDVKEDGSFFLTTIGELILEDLLKKGNYNKKHLKINR